MVEKGPKVSKMGMIDVLVQACLIHVRFNCY